MAGFAFDYMWDADLLNDIALYSSQQLKFRYSSIYSNCIIRYQRYMAEVVPSQILLMNC